MADDRTITDPERIRALAHPLRLQLLDLLSDVPEATATECAEHVGESVASCSFHLRILEKYGFIERAEQRGREKPWRALPGGLSLRPSPDEPESLPAAAELAALTVRREFDRLRDYLLTIANESDEWIQSTQLLRSSFWATADELAEVARELQAITDRFTGRSDDPSLRPEGARLSRLFATLNPDPEDTSS